MAVDETKVRIRLETSEAQGQLKELVESAGTARQKISKFYQSTIGAGINAIGLGGAFATGMAVVQGATQSGLGDVLSDVLQPLAKHIENTIFGDKSMEARALKSAREDAIHTFGTIYGATGAFPIGTMAYFKNRQSIAMMQQRTRNAFESDPAFHLDPQKLIDQVKKGIHDLLSEFVELIWQKFIGGAGPIATPGKGFFGDGKMGGAAGF